MISITDGEKVVLKNNPELDVVSASIYENMYIYGVKFKDPNDLYYGPLKAVDIDTGKYVGSFHPFKHENYKEKSKLVYRK